MEVLFLIALIIVAALFLRQPEQPERPIFFVGRPEDLAPQSGDPGLLPFVLLAVLIIALLLGAQ